MSTYTVFGATGQVGGAVVRSLMLDAHRVRVVVRDRAKAEALFSHESGVDVCVGTLDDPSSVERAFEGAEGAFVLNPPAYTSSDMFEDARRVSDAIASAAVRTRLPKLVALSSVGAHRLERQGNIRTTTILEQTLGSLSLPTAFVRAAWFIENWAGALGAARAQSVLPSFLDPLERAIPMVGTADIGHVCAQVLGQAWAGRRVVELHGPADVAPRDVAAAASRVLGHPISAALTDRSQWRTLLAGFGFSSATVDGWVEMLESFNDGWLAFDGVGTETIRGKEPIDTTVRRLLGSAG